MGEPAIQGRAELVERIEPAPPEMVAALAEFKRDCRRLNACREELRASFPDQWVAVHADDVYHAATLDQLFASLHQAGVEPGVVPYELLEREPRILIF